MKIFSAFSARVGLSTAALSGSYLRLTLTLAASTAVPLTVRHRSGSGEGYCTGLRFAHFLPARPEKSTDQRALAAIRRAIEPAESAILLD